MNIKADILNYYDATKEHHLNLSALREDAEADAVIIDSDFSGTNIALEPTKQGIASMMVLEARYLGYGGTGHDGGQMTAGISHDIKAVKKHVGKEGLETLFKTADLDAGIIRERIRKYHTDADFVPGYSYLAYNQRQLKMLRQWEKELKAATPDEKIELYTGKEVQQMVGSEVYCGALKHMDGGQTHSLNMLFGSVQVAHSLRVKIFESSPVVEVNYGKQMQIRAATDSIKAAKLLWACGSFLDNTEPEIYNKTLVTYSCQVSTGPLSDELIERISLLRGAFSDIRSAINYCRITWENHLLFGSATRFVEYTPNDFAAWNRTLLAEVFPYLKDAKIDFAWGEPMACSANLFPQTGTLRDHNNAFHVQGYSGFGVIPSYIVCKILAEGINDGSDHYRLPSSILHVTIRDYDSLRLLLVTAGKLMYQTAGFWKGRS